MTQRKWWYAFCVIFLSVFLALSRTSCRIPLPGPLRAFCPAIYEIRAPAPPRNCNQIPAAANSLLIHTDLEDSLDDYPFTPSDLQAGHGFGDLEEEAILPLLHAPKRPISMARVYADVNAQMPRAYWDYDSVNISWGILENYEVVRKIGRGTQLLRSTRGI